MPSLYTRRVPSRRSVVLLAFLCLVGACGRLLCKSGLWDRILRPAPLLDPSTPRVQGNFTLAEIHREDADKSTAAFVLFTLPSLPKCERGGQDDGYTIYSLPWSPVLSNGTLQAIGTPPIIQATGQTSDGDIQPLPWEIVGDGIGPKYVRVSIPAGYSNACRFLDITLIAGNGPFPRWRITRLPSMHQTLSTSPAVQDTQTVQGITVTARAWRTRHRIYLQMRPILPTNSHQWEFISQQTWSEWEKFGQTHTPNTDTGNCRPIEGRNGHFTENDARWSGPLMTIFPGDYRSASQFVRMDCGLRQFETLDERVTFPNVKIINDPRTASSPSIAQEEKAYYFSVPKTTTLTTPSGIAVTLPAQGGENDENMSGSINFSMATKSDYEPSDLPKSPLVHQFEKPVAVSVQFAPPNELGGWTMGPGDMQTYSLHLPMNPMWSSKLSRQQMLRTSLILAPPVRENLTVIVHQRVEIQTIPLSFTVPVADEPPPDFHW